MHRSITDIKQDLKSLEEVSVKPDFDRPKEGDILDENKSVVWNREQVASLQIAYDDELKRRKADKQQKHSQLMAELYDAIVSEVGNITTGDAAAIYSYAYEEGHSGGYDNVFVYLEELMDLIGDIVNKRNKCPIATTGK